MEDLEKEDEINRNPKSAVDIAISKISFSYSKSINGIKVIGRSKDPVGRPFRSFGYCRNRADSAACKTAIALEYIKKYP